MAIHRVGGYEVHYNPEQVVTLVGMHRPNKARNQSHGKVDAPWFKKLRIRSRKRSKIARRSRQRNR